MNLPLWDICASKHGGNPQSVKANEIAHKWKISKRQLILEHLEAIPSTCEELERATGFSHQTCSARLSELKNPKQPGGPKIKVVGDCERNGDRNDQPERFPLLHCQQ